MAMVALIEEGRVVITATVFPQMPHDASSVIEAKSRPIKSEAKRSTDRALDEQMSRRSNEASLVFISTESDKSNGRLQGPQPIKRNGLGVANGNYAARQCHDA
ncbi:unnamed protein product [Fusarium fujikuroi]|nr:unnamed protein product [Fusarium fujikuroi]